MLIRQGDVLLVRVGRSPRGRTVPREDGRLVLATGEVTGHAHVVRDESAELVSAAGVAELYLIVHGGKPATLTHEEHRPLAVPPGTYQVVRQREYTPAAIRYVED
jgi:hypothetical protein